MNFRALVLALFVLAFVFIFADSGYACSCVAVDKPIKVQVKAAEDGASTVFSGEVLEITPSADNLSVTVRIKVETIWKGVKTAEKTITTARDSAACGYAFTVGQKYLVYTHKNGDAESTSNCSRTTQLSGAKKDIAYLGKKIRK